MTHHRDHPSRRRRPRRYLCMYWTCLRRCCNKTLPHGYRLSSQPKSGIKYLRPPPLAVGDETSKRAWFSGQQQLYSQARIVFQSTTSSTNLTSLRLCFSLRITTTVITACIPLSHRSANLREADHWQKHRLPVSTHIVAIPTSTKPVSVSARPPSTQQHTRLALASPTCSLPGQHA